MEIKSENNARCLNCDIEIREKKIDSNSTFYCPNCKQTYKNKDFKENYHLIINKIVIESPEGFHFKQYENKNKTELIRDSDNQIILEISYSNEISPILINILASNKFKVYHNKELISFTDILREILKDGKTISSLNLK
jgi:hypothetical protein